MRGFWFVMIIYCMALLGTCFWLMAQIEQQAELLEDARITESESDSFSDRQIPPVPDPDLNDTVVYSWIKNNQTGMTTRINRAGQIIDTFTVVPIFDSLLINHSKIPNEKDARKKRKYKSQ